MDNLAELFEGATCVYITPGRKEKQTFRFGLDDNSDYIDILTTMRYNSTKNGPLKIVSIDLAGSKLGELLNEFRATNK